MQEFHDPSLLEQVAYDRYLQHKPQQAMERLMVDVQELAGMVKSTTPDTFDTVAFEDLLSLVQSGMRGLVQLAFNPEENAFYTTKFRAELARIIKSFIHDAPAQFFQRLNMVGYHYSHIKPRLRVKKPTLSVKKYLAGIATAIAGVIGAGHVVPPPRHDVKIPVMQPLDDLDSEPEMIEVDLPPSTESSGAAQHKEGAFKSPFVASSLEKAKQKDREGAELKKEKTAEFLRQTKEQLDSYTLQYQQYFAQKELIIGGALPHNVASADANFKNLVAKLRPKVSSLSTQQYLELIAPFIASPLTKNDNRNSRSYLTDLFNEVVRGNDAKDDSYVGNCEARTSAYLALTQELRPDLVKDSFVQVFKGHVRFGMKDGKKLYGVDSEVKELQPRHVNGTALASPEEFFVHPLLTGQSYKASEHIQGLKYRTHHKSPKTDSLLPGLVSDGLKSFDDEQVEDLVETSMSRDEAKKMVEKNTLEGDCDSPEGSSRCLYGKPRKNQTEEQFIRELQKNPDNYMAVDLGEMPLTPKLIGALSRLHYLSRLEVHESGLISEVPSPLLTLVDDPASANYTITPSDLLADLLRKTPSLTRLRLQKLQYASSALKDSVRKLPALQKLFVSERVVSEFSEVVDPETLDSPRSLLLSGFSLEYIVQLNQFATLNISLTDVPSWEVIESWLKSLPPEAIDEIYNFNFPKLVLVPPVSVSVLLKTIPHQRSSSKGWNHEVVPHSWGFGITDFSPNMPKDSRIDYRASGAEVLRQYTALYASRGMDVLSQVEYLSLLASAPDLKSFPFDTKSIAIFPQIADYLPSAIWGSGHVNLYGSLPDRSDDFLRCRPWVKGK